MGKLANGFLCFGPATFVSCAFILSQFAQKGCKFIKLGDGDTTDLSGGVVVDGVIEYAGLDCWQSNGIDFVYNENFQYSPEHELARKMAMAVTIMGATCWGVYFLSGCVKFAPEFWGIISLTLLATCICEGVIFRFFSTEWCQVSDCKLATSSRCGISACVFWGISSFMTCGIFQEARTKQRDQSGGNEVRDEEDGQ